LRGNDVKSKEEIGEEEIEQRETKEEMFGSC